jgi:YD repeat-containing protein
LYQWRFNGTNLIGQTNSFLALTNLTWNQTGFYSVTISNGYGSVTSANAILVVADFLHGNRFYYDHEDRLVGAEYLRGISIAYVYDGNGNLVRQAVLSRASETDGLPVLWRFLNGLSPTDNSGVNAPYADADGDGWSNYAEWVAGTNPTNAQSMPTNAPNSMPVAVVMPGTNVLGPQANVPIVMSNALGNPSVPYLQYQFSGSTTWQDATILSVDGTNYSSIPRVAAWPTGTSCYELFSDRTFHQIGVVRFWGMRPGWHRVFWPNNRAVVVWLWPGVSGRAAIVSGGFSSACHDGIVKCCELF